MSERTALALVLIGISILVATQWTLALIRKEFEDEIEIYKEKGKR